MSRCHVFRGPRLYPFPVGVMNSSLSLYLCVCVSDISELVHLNVKNMVIESGIRVATLTHKQYLILLDSIEDYYVPRNSRTGETS